MTNVQDETSRLVRQVAYVRKHASVLFLPQASLFLGLLHSPTVLVDKKLRVTLGRLLELGLHHNLGALLHARHKENVNKRPAEKEKAWAAPSYPNIHLL